MPQIPQNPQPPRRPNPGRPYDPQGAHPYPPVRRNPAPKPNGQPRPQNPGGPYPPRNPENPQFPPRRRPPKKPTGPNIPLIIAIVLLVIGTAVMIALCVNLAKDSSKPVPTGTAPVLETTEGKNSFWKDEEPETEAPAELNQVVSTAKFTATGDLLIHRSLFNGSSAANLGDKGYNFDTVFKFLGGYTDTADYAIANLETTLFGPGKPYSGNPKFNTPDALVDSAKAAGFDMLLTANNHCNDTDLEGILRTLKVVREKGLKTLGTNLTNEEEKYVIEDVNGIKVGMLCYTYEDSQNPNVETFNYNPLPSKGKGLVCAFPKFENAKSREPFYTALAQQIEEMREKGAEAIVLFMHWGEEYQLEASQDQKNMAQKLCDLGVDLIVGGHPHVVQPMELLTSTTDPDHKTVCLYSMGNAVSNQRREEMSSRPTGHTEDGMLFNFTFEKYSDGTVALGSVEVIPTWVDMHNNADGKREYNILPLENARRSEWGTLFGLDAGRLPSLDASYQRTMDIVGTGLEASNSYLTSLKQEILGIPADAA